MLRYRARVSTVKHFNSFDSSDITKNKRLSVKFSNGIITHFGKNTFKPSFCDFSYSKVLFTSQIVRGYMDQLKDKIEEESDRADEAEEEAKVWNINIFYINLQTW